MASETRYATVLSLQQEGVLRVEDGNHGEYRPRPDEFVEKGVAFIRAADMESGRVLFESASAINENAKRRITKGIGAGGDILLSHKGTVGKVAVVPIDAPDFVCSPQTTFWRTLDESVLDRRYLYAYLRSSMFHTQLAARAGETDMAPYVSLTSQRGLTVALPTIEQQRYLGKMLGELDDKIELNRKMNETLEAMARALFQSWFVDFDPVRAKAEGRPTGLPDSIAALFPNSFQDSAIGIVPEGWAVAGLDEIATFLNGLALQKYPATGDSSLPAIKIAQLRAGTTDGADRVSADVPVPYRVQDGDVLFSWSGSLECKVWTSGLGALNQHLFKVTSEKYPKWFYLQWVLEHLSSFRKIAAAKATTMGHIQRQHLTQALVLIPPPQLMADMAAHFEPILDAQISRMLESRSLISHRDALLPKLISGELRLQECDSLMEETI